MNWEGIASVTSLIGLIFTLIGGGFWLSFFSGKFITKLSSFEDLFKKFVNDFEKHIEKEDAQLKVMWEKIDGHDDAIKEHKFRLDLIDKQND